MSSPKPPEADVAPPHATDRPPARAPEVSSPTPSNISPHTLVSAPPQAGRRLVPSVTVIPNVSALIHSAYAVIGTELARLQAKAARGITLDARETRQLRDYVESLTKLSQEEREISKKADLSHMSDEDLLRLVDDALQTVGAKTPPKSE